jgi:hypothetical protein
VQKYSYLCIIILCLFACAPEKVNVPGDILSQHRMSEILADMHIADAVTNMKSLSTDSLRQMGVDYREFIYKKHHTDHTAFSKSFEFYKEHPLMMDSIYAEVITRLSDMEGQYRGQ